MLNKLFEIVLEVSGSVVNFLLEFIRSPIKVIYPYLKALYGQMVRLSTVVHGVVPER